MKTVILDPDESDCRSGEGHLTYSIAAQQDFQDLDKFVFATIETGAYGKDERWYHKTSATGDRIAQELARALSDFTKQRSELPATPLDGVMFSEDWDHTDFAYRSDKNFVRVSWYTTA